MEIPKISHRRRRISRCCFAEDVKKCTKISNARAQLLFYSLNLSFGDVLVARVVVAACLSSLLKGTEPHAYMEIQNHAILFILVSGIDHWRVHPKTSATKTMVYSVPIHVECN